MIECKQNIISYNKILEEDKLVAKQNKLLKNNHLIHENLNAGKIRCVEALRNDKYGLTSVLFNIITSMSITNEKIVESNNLYRKIKENSDKILFFNSYFYAKYQRLNESIVHDIKSFCDKLIIISFLIIENEVISNLKVTGIRKYFEDNRHFFQSDENFLNLINDLDNSYKHSFSNDMDSNRIGLYDNCIINYYSKHGKDIFNPKIISAKLDDLVDGFNHFFNSVEKFCKDHTNP